MDIVSLDSPLPVESRCNPGAFSGNRGGCSSNTDCECHSLTNGQGICASIMISCSTLTPCEVDRSTCLRPNTVCIQNHRCSNRPVCYPKALADLAVCPSLPSTNQSIVTEPPLSIKICDQAIWNQPKRVPWLRYGFDLWIEYPEDIFIDKNQKVFMAGPGNHAVGQWELNATHGVIVAGGNGEGNANDELRRPTSVIVDVNGDLIICDSGNRRIVKWPMGSDRGETIIDKSTPNFTGCDKLIVSKSGTIFIRDAGRFLKWTSNITGNYIELIRNVSGGKSYFLSSSGDVYGVSEPNGIKKWALGDDTGVVVAGGSRRPGNQSNELYNPTAVIVNDEGTMYIFDNGNRRVLQWRAGATEGTVVAKYSDSINKVFGIHDGGLYYSLHSYANYVYHFPIDTSACGKLKYFLLD
ncbi:unnamed protein product [Adineta ricciae]|uniref:Uncharacterized protein n=2 Tax=Adineta ricciae TaxID=249248 RepID=A0A814ZQA7_ADIRI|nr:unnamed protein product [Adineta ricciae]